MNLTHTHKWVIGGIIVAVVVIVALLADSMNLIPFMNRMRDLQKQNELLKRQATAKETEFSSVLKQKDVQLQVIDKKIVDLQKRNAQLVETNKRLELERTELEQKYDEIKKKLANIQVPTDRPGRAARLRELGY